MRGGVREGAGRLPSSTLEESISALETLLERLKHPDGTAASALAQELFRDAMRLRRRLLRRASSSDAPV